MLNRPTRTEIADDNNACESIDAGAQTALYASDGRMLTANISSLPVGVQFCGQRVCMSECPRAYQKNWMSKFSVHGARPWLWLGLIMVAVQYVMYFRFCGRRHVFR